MALKISSQLSEYPHGEFDNIIDFNKVPVFDTGELVKFGAPKVCWGGSLLLLHGGLYIRGGASTRNFRVEGFSMIDTTQTSRSVSLGSGVIPEL